MKRVAEAWRDHRTDLDKDADALTAAVRKAAKQERRRHRDDAELGVPSWVDGGDPYAPAGSIHPRNKQRIATRIALLSARPRDLSALRAGLQQLPLLRTQLTVEGLALPVFAPFFVAPHWNPCPNFEREPVD